MANSIYAEVLELLFLCVYKCGVACHGPQIDFINLTYMLCD